MPCRWTLPSTGGSSAVRFARPRLPNSSVGMGHRYGASSASIGPSAGTTTAFRAAPVPIPDLSHHLLRSLPCHSSSLGQCTDTASTARTRMSTRCETIVSLTAQIRKSTHCLSIQLRHTAAAHPNPIDCSPTFRYASQGIVLAFALMQATHIVLPAECTPLPLDCGAPFG